MLALISLAIRLLWATTLLLSIYKSTSIPLTSRHLAMLNTGVSFCGSVTFRRLTERIKEGVVEQSLLPIYPWYVIHDNHVIISWIPLIHQVVGKKNDNPEKLAHHRAEVYHKALRIVFRHLEIPAVHGLVFNILRTKKRGLPMFLAISADYEEMWVDSIGSWATGIDLEIIGHIWQPYSVLTAHTRVLCVWYPSTKCSGWAESGRCEQSIQRMS